MSEKNKKLENGGDTENLKTKSTLDEDKFVDIIKEKRDNYFIDLREVIFYKNKENKLMGRLTSGKYVLLHKSEDPSIVTEGLPYICVLRHLEKVAFAKVISPVFLPRVIIRRNGIILVYKNKENKIIREKLDDISILWEKVDKLKIEKFITIIRREKDENPYSLKKQ